MDECGYYDVSDMPFNKLYSGSLPFSLELLELDSQFPAEIKTLSNKNKSGLAVTKQYTDAIVDVKFNCDYFKMCDKKRYVAKGWKFLSFDQSILGIAASKYKLRSELYDGGFKIKKNGKEIEYVKYARSSSKARTGHRLFIKKDLFDYMSVWKSMNIAYSKTKTVGDLAGLLSYESLTLSGLENLVKIDPMTQILLVDDIKTEYKSFASVTEIENGVLVSNEKEIDNSSNVFDGESLADESLFAKDQEGNQYSMLLLRQRFFKSAAFNVRLQDYFKDHENPKCLYDMFGNKMETSKIKLIITPSSLKILKYATIFVEFKVFAEDGNVDEVASQKKCYDFWRNSVSEIFGVCKHDKGSKFGDKAQLSYQIINSLPLNYKDVEEITRSEVGYVNDLKTDIEAVRRHIKSELHKNNTFLDNLLAVNDDFAKTNIYIGMRNDIVDAYIKNLKQGHIKVSNTDYATLLGNPIELLKHAMGQKNDKSLHSGYEAWCSRFNDGDEMCAFRSPHICSGNVVVLKNVWKEEFEYLNLSPNIIVTNAWDCDLLDRFSGADMDSDFCVLSTHKTLLDASKMCLSYPTPINRVSPSAKERSYDSHNQYMVDRIVSDNLIGRICNLGQIYNSYYWQEYNSQVPDEKKMKIIYDQISMLSSLSQIEIDGAKKTYDINVKKEFMRILNCEYNGEKIIETSIIKEFKNNCYDNELFSAYEDLEYQLMSGEIDHKEYKSLFVKLKEEYYDILEKEKPIKPMFFKYVSGDKKCGYKKFNCPMDHLLDVLKVNIVRCDNRTVVDIGEVLGMKSISDSMGRTGRRHRKRIVDIAYKIDDERNRVFQQYCNDEIDFLEYCKQKDLIYENLLQDAPKKISIETVRGILCNCYSRNKKWEVEELRRKRRIIVRMLHSLYPQTMLEAVKLIDSKR